MEKRHTIVFFGSKNHAVSVLRNIVNEKSVEVLLVVTTVQKNPGAPNEILKLANEKNIPTFFWPEDSSLNPLLEKLKDANANFLLVSDFGKKIPPAVLGLSKYGSLNIHPSLLPKYRGTTPVPSAIMGGETETGVTIILMDELFDHGPIVAQAKIPLPRSSEAPVLYEKLFNIGTSILPNCLNLLADGTPKTYSENNADFSVIYFSPPAPQDESKATYTKQLIKDDGRINWLDSDLTIYNHVRAFKPWPGSWTTLGELCEKYNALKTPKNPNLIVKILSAVLNNGKLTLETLQIEGKNPIHWNQFSGGYLK